METISIQSNLKQVKAIFERQMSAKNMRFATALSITRLAQMAQAQVRQDMDVNRGGPFHIRRKWVVDGIRYRPASKTTLEATVFSVDSGGRRPFMSLQEFGGTKLPLKSKHVAIPLRSVQPSKRALIRPELKPKSLLAEAVAPPEARGSSTYMNPKGYRTEKTRGRGTNKVTVRVKVAFANPYKTILVKGKKPGTEVILIRVGKKYRPAWYLRHTANIKQTHFLATPSRYVVEKHADAVLMENFKKVMFEK